MLKIKQVKCCNILLPPYFSIAVILTSLLTLSSFTTNTVYGIPNVYYTTANESPVANAGTDRTVNSGSVVTLSGTASRDPDGSITSYSWIQIAGPSVTLYGANTYSPTFTVPSNLNLTSDTTTLKFSLTVKDDKGTASTNPAIVSVTVKAATPSQSITTPPVTHNQTIPGNVTSMTTTPSNQTTLNLTSQLAPVDGIPCDHLEHTRFHLHTHIDIFVDGKAITIPKNIGIVPGECLHWIHTHD